MRWFLFETWVGDRLLALFERFTGLAVVPVGQLQPQREPGDVEHSAAGAGGGYSRSTHRKSRKPA